MPRDPNQVSAEEIERLWGALGGLSRHVKHLNYKIRRRTRHIKKQQKIISDLIHLSFDLINNLDKTQLTNTQLARLRSLETTARLAKNFLRGSHDYPDGQDDYNNSHHPNTITNINISKIMQEEESELLHPTAKISRETS